MSTTPFNANLIRSKSVSCRRCEGRSSSFLVEFTLIDDPFRYSFWVLKRERQYRQPGDSVHLMRDPPEGIGRKDRGWFTTRSLHSSKWRAVVSGVCHQLHAEKAFDQAEAELKAQMREADQADRRRVAKARAERRMARAAPALIAACQRALKDDARGPHLSIGTVDALHAALKKAGAS